MCRFINGTLNKTAFGQPQKLLAPLDESVSIFDGGVGKEDGHDVMYTTAKGIPATLNVIDLDDYKLLRSIPLEGSDSSWHHEMVPNGNVYIATEGGVARSINKCFGLHVEEESLNGKVYFVADNKVKTLI